MAKLLQSLLKAMAIGDRTRLAYLPHCCVAGRGAFGY